MVIPAFRAASTIRSLVPKVSGLGLPVIVVDDASGDATADEARRAGARVITRSVNGGKGQALREGFALALRQGHSWVLTMDADGQHLPSEVPRFLQAAAQDQADLIVGNRMGNPKGMPFDRRLTNRFMSWLISLMTAEPVPDTQCGFRLISRRVLERVRLVSDRFEIESELVVKAIQAGFRVSSIPISSIYRRQMSFIRPLRDTVRFLRFLSSLRREGQ